MVPSGQGAIKLTEDRIYNPIILSPKQAQAAGVFIKYRPGRIAGVIVLLALHHALGGGEKQLTSAQGYAHCYFSQICVFCPNSYSVAYGYSYLWLLAR